MTKPYLLILNIKLYHFLAINQQCIFFIKNNNIKLKIALSNIILEKGDKLADTSLPQKSDETTQKKICNY